MFEGRRSKENREEQGVRSNIIDSTIKTKRRRGAGLSRSGGRANGGTRGGGSGDEDGPEARGLAELERLPGAVERVALHDALHPRRLCERERLLDFFWCAGRPAPDGELVDDERDCERKEEPSVADVPRGSRFLPEEAHSRGEIFIGSRSAARQSRVPFTLSELISEAAPCGSGAVATTTLAPPSSRSEAAGSAPGAVVWMNS